MLCNNKALELEQLQKQHMVLEKAHSNLVQQEQKNLQALAVIQERSEHAQKVIVERDLDLANKTHRITELEKEMAVLQDQHRHTEHALTKAEYKIESLREEKQFLAQEKHELQGYMRQLKNTSKKTSETMCLKS